LAKISEDAAAIAAAGLVQAHATALSKGKGGSPDGMVKQLAWAYQQYLDVVRGEGVTQHDDPPLDYDGPPLD